MKKNKLFENVWQGSHLMWKRRGGALALALVMTASATATPAMANTTVELEQTVVSAEEDTSVLPTGGVIYDIEEVPEVATVAPANFSVVQMYASSGSLAAGSEKYGYSHLSTAQKAFYDDCLAAIEVFLSGDYKNKDFSSSENNTTVTSVDYSKHGLAIADATAAYYCLRDDYPELYWLWYGFAYSSKELMLQIGADYYTAAARAEMDAAITSEINEYKSAVSGLTDTYEIVRTVHDKLVTDVEYAYDSNKQPVDELWAHSIAGVVDGHNEVVCEGYSKMFQLVLNELDIENVYMVGTADGGGHAWNGVKIDDEWLYVDTTWDDTGAGKGGGGIRYAYFCIPASVFTDSHTENTPSNSGSNWLYAIPKMSESSDYTFYARYNCDFTSLILEDDVKKQLETAGKSVPGDYIHALGNKSVMECLAPLTNVWSYSNNPDGNYVMYIDATDYKVQYPAIGITMSETALEIDRDTEKTAKLSVTLEASGGMCDDAVRWSVSSSNVSVVPSADGRSALITGKRNGFATVTATAVKGGVSASCIVEVKGESETENIYSDSAFSKAPTEEELTFWVNGGNVGKTKDTKYNYKSRTLYTDIKASTITTTDAKGKTKEKKGKLVVGVTTSAEQPTLTKNKIVDAEAAKVAKATINAKTGAIKVTAQKQTGTVYVWVIDTGDAGAVAYTKLNVIAAPSKIYVNDAAYDADSREVVKKETMAIDSSLKVYLEPLVKNKEATIAEGGSYYVTFSKGGEEYVKVSEIEGSKYGYIITPIAMNAAKPGKTVKVTVNFVCTENNKKASVSITITNPVKTVAYEAGSGLTLKEADTFTIPYSEDSKQEATVHFNPTLTNSEYDTTDKMKVYAISGENGYSIDEKGKIKAVKPSGDAAKMKASLSKDKKSIIVKVPKGLAVGTKAYFMLYYNGNSCNAFSVEVVE